MEESVELYETFEEGYEFNWLCVPTCTSSSLVCQSDI